MLTIKSHTDLKMQKHGQKRLWKGQKPRNRYIVGIPNWQVEPPSSRWSLMEEPTSYTCKPSRAACKVKKTRYRRASMLGWNERRSCLGQKQLRPVSSYGLRARSRGCVLRYLTRLGALLPNPQHHKTIINDAPTTTTKPPRFRQPQSVYDTNFWWAQWSWRRFTRFILQNKTQTFHEPSKYPMNPTARNPTTQFPSEVHNFPFSWAH